MGHILIIEDEMLIAMHLEALVSDIDGVSVDIAAELGEAVDLARAKPPALIISDVRLAEGTGPAAVAAIRESVGVVPVIYVTGNPDQIEEDAPIFSKPVRDHELIAAASEMLGRHRSGAEPSAA